MDKPEYSDLYKFVASVGVILIGLAVLLPWLILREPFDTHLTDEELQKLSQTAQTLITYRQSTALWWVQNVGWFSGGLFLAGAVVLISGVFLWRRKQIVIDEKERFETEKLRRELAPIPAAQLAERKIEEAVQQVKAEKGEQTKVEQQDTSEPADQELANIEIIRQVGSTVQRAFEIERLLYFKIRNCLWSMIEIYRDRQIENEYFDIILSPKDKIDDILIEIKYSSNPFRISHVKSILSRQIDKLDAYREGTQRHAKVFIVFVSNQGFTTAAVKLLNEESSFYRSVLVEYIHLTEYQLETIDCTKLTSMFFPVD